MLAAARWGRLARVSTGALTSRERSSEAGQAESSCVPLGKPVCTEQQCQPPEDIVHPGGCEDAGSIDESSPIDGPDLRDVHDTCVRESRFTPAKTNVPRHGTKPEVRRDSRDDGG